jgi:ABC-2 type transport system permease protein
MGVIIFGSITGYGGLITRSVIEEKTNRIVEVIASSVKPIELLFGKLCGIGALALTQMTFWVVSLLGLAAAAGPVAGMFLTQQMETMPNAQQAAQASQGLDPSIFEIPTIETSLIIYFGIFFILGYLIYSALFAAIGSAVDSEADTQQYMFPIMVPIMIAYFIMFQAMENPDSTLSVIGSLIPFCTPIVMITRIAITDVPFWQIATSIVLMIATFGATMWLSAKIYAVGILSYGKSANFKELMKWIRA